MNKPDPRPPFIHTDGSLWFLNRDDIYAHYKPLADAMHSQAVDGNNKVTSVKAYNKWEDIRRDRARTLLDFETVNSQQRYYETALTKAESESETKAFIVAYQAFIRRQLAYWKKQQNNLNNLQTDEPATR